MLPISRFAPLPEHASSIGGGLTAPKGFLAAGVASGVKKRGKLDLGLVLSEQPAVSAATFTSNAAAAAPVRLTRETSDCGHLRAVVVNAGNANACTGKQGLADAARMRLLTANHLRLPVEQVAVCSTGLIGVHLPMDKVEPGIAAAAAELPVGGDAKAADHFSGAIRTTDKHAKKGALEVATPEGKVKLGFAAKGCGMISPNMATMLCFVTCDAQVDGAAWTGLLHGAVDRSFNRITVDGQESTNDTVLGLCNGASGIAPGEEGLARLGHALDAALLALALSIVADGEGSTRTMKLTVTGAKDEGRAEAVARAVANSPLVKTAFFGRDPNWGRIMQAIGQALGRDGRDHLPARIAYEDLVIVEHGQPAALGEAQQGRLTEIMHQPEIDLTVALNGPGAEATVYFSDLTHDYVTLNAEYST
jgi:glutamate N-acetyltransferase/amino-acid N-acetyltransferase